MPKLLLFSLSLAGLSYGQTSQVNSTTPVATQWLYDAIAPGSRGTVDSVVRITCPNTGSVGSGFILSTGYVITNHHVVQGCAASELFVLTSSAVPIAMVDVWSDDDRDLAAIRPKVRTTGTFKLAPKSSTLVGTQLSAWGYPFAHPGPAPLLTVGFLSGFYEYVGEHRKALVKRLVVNGAFNPGNSGGPLILPDGTIAGVVVAKRSLVLPSALASALKALADNGSGLQFSAVQSDGKQMNFSESQLTAAILDYYRQMSQVYIGEAVAASELADFLDANKVPWKTAIQTAHPKKTAKVR